MLFPPDQRVNGVDPGPRTRGSDVSALAYCPLLFLRPDSRPLPLRVYRATWAIRFPVVRCACSQPEPAVAIMSLPTWWGRSSTGFVVCCVRARPRRD